MRNKSLKKNLQATITVVGRDVQPIMDLYKFYTIVYEIIIKQEMFSVKYKMKTSMYNIVQKICMKFGIKNPAV